MAVVSILLYVVWFFVLNFTTKGLDNMTFSRMRAIEDALTATFHYKFGIHSYIEYESEESCWLKIRRRFWLWVLVLLIVAWASVLAF